MSKAKRTTIKDIPVALSQEQGASKGEPLSDEALEGVIGGATFSAGRAAFGQTVFAAHGTKQQTNTNDNGCHDSDSEWDYSSY